MFESESLEEGASHPRGATPMEGGVNFALFTAHATRVEVCIFDDAGDKEIARVALPESTDEVWHGFIPGLKPGARYGYRVHGHSAPTPAHRQHELYASASAASSASLPRSPTILLKQCQTARD